MMIFDYYASQYICDDLPYRSFKCTESRKFRMHRHDFWEIVYVYEGIGENHTENGSDIITEGKFLLISPGIAHTITSNADTSCPGVRVYNCLFTTEFFNSVLSDYFKISRLESFKLYSMLKNNETFCIQLNDNETKTIRSYVCDINREYGKIDLRIDCIIRNALLNLLIEATRIYTSSKSLSSYNTDENNLIVSLKQYMKANLDSKISLTSLAEQVHLAPAYLSRYFKSVTGETISEYLFRIRIERATKLLVSTAYPISEISAFCGYTSVGNFQRYFKKYVGMSPGKYRQEYRQ